MRINELKDERRLFQQELSDIKREFRSMQVAKAERSDPGMSFAFPVTCYGINFTVTQITQC